MPEPRWPLLAGPGPDAPEPARPDPWWLYAAGPQVCAESEWRGLALEVAR